MFQNLLTQKGQRAVKSLSLVQVFQKFESLGGLSDTDRMKLSAVREIIREYDVDVIQREQIKSSEDAFNFLTRRLAGLQQEHMLLLLLDSKNRIRKVETVFVGTVNSAAVSPRELITRALLAGEPVVRIMIAHNHPSGDPTPSYEDQVFTQRLEEACDCVGLSFLDHIIVGEKCVSLRELGLI